MFFTVQKSADNNKITNTKLVMNESLNHPQKMYVASAIPRKNKWKIATYGCLKRKKFLMNLSHSHIIHIYMMACVQLVLLTVILMYSKNRLRQMALCHHVDATKEKETKNTIKSCCCQLVSSPKS